MWIWRRKCCSTRWNCRSWGSRCCRLRWNCRRTWGLHCRRLRWCCMLRSCWWAWSLRSLSWRANGAWWTWKVFRRALNRSCCRVVHLSRLPLASRKESQGISSCWCKRRCCFWWSITTKRAVRWYWRSNRRKLILYWWKCRRKCRRIHHEWCGERCRWTKTRNWLMCG